jgi:hypothetical protein
MSILWITRTHIFQRLIVMMVILLENVDVQWEKLQLHFNQCGGELVFGCHFRNILQHLIYIETGNVNCDTVFSEYAKGSLAHDGR